MAQTMYCPKCGQALVEIEREKPDWADSDEWTKEEIDRAASLDRDQSVWFKCSSCRCFGDHFPLIMHHPFGDHKSRPGDSWSLSFAE